MNIFMIIRNFIQLADGLHVLHIHDRIPLDDMATCINNMIKINQGDRAALRGP